MARRRGKESEKRVTVRIRQVTTPDNERRLSRAIEVLLMSAAGELKESTNVKNGKSHQDSQPEKVAGQSDGEKGEA